MNKLICGISTFLLLFSSACTLESVVYDKIPGNDFPGNEEDVRSLVSASAYNVFSPRKIFNVAAGYCLTSDMVTDMGECSWGNWENWKYNSYEANDILLNDAGRNIYFYSNHLSSMILNIDRIRSVPMDAALLERYTAELKCGLEFLAFIYYDMFGPIPIPDLETLKNPREEKIVPRLSEEQMQEFIVSNLTEAARVLPYRYEDADYGRFTKGLAKTVLLKFYMLTHQWDKAVEIGDELCGEDMEGNPDYGYRLVDDYNSLFDMSTEKNPEVIFAATAKRGITHGDNQWLAHAMTSDFPTPDNITKWGGYKLAWPFYQEYEADKGRDHRLDRIHAEYVGTGDDPVTHSYAIDRPSNGLLYLGAVPQKYSFDGTVGDEMSNDIPVYRYADVVTLYGEALVRSTNTVPEKSKKALNMLRTRAGLDPLPDVEMNTPELYLDALLKERGIEFYYEGVRRQDLIRHGKFIEKALEKARFAGFSTEKIDKQVDGVYKYERFPLPTSVITEGKGLIKQNPGCCISNGIPAGCLPRRIIRSVSHRRRISRAACMRSRPGRNTRWMSVTNVCRRLSNNWAARASKRPNSIGTSGPTNPGISCREPRRSSIWMGSWSSPTCAATSRSPIG